MRAASFLLYPLFKVVVLEATRATYLKRSESNLRPLQQRSEQMSNTEPSAFEYSAQFEASWSIQLFFGDGEVSQSAACFDIHHRPVTVACENGSFIEYVNSTDNLMNCTNTSESALDCIASEGSFLNQFVRVFYVCRGPSRPSTRVTYPEAVAYCESITATATVQHAASLGVACQDETSFMYTYRGDLLLECPDSNLEVDPTSSDVRCSEGASFVAGSTSNNSQTIPTVEVVTDEAWFSQDLFENCFTYLSVPQNLPTTPVMPPTTSPPPFSDNGQGGTSTGAAIGGVAAGLVVVVAIGFFVRRKYKKQRTSSKQPDLNATETEEEYPDRNATDAGRGPELSIVLPVTASVVEESAFNLSYKCQCRSVEEPRNQVPFAHAIAVGKTVIAPS